MGLTGELLKAGQAKLRAARGAHSKCASLTLRLQARLEDATAVGVDDLRKLIREAQFSSVEPRHAWCEFRHLSLARRFRRRG